MCTIMQKDVLIEMVASTLAMIHKRTEPNAPLNEDARFLARLRGELYRTHHDEIDYEKTSSEIVSIRDKYKDLPRHSYYL